MNNKRILNDAEKNKRKSIGLNEFSVGISSTDVLKRRNTLPAADKENSELVENVKVEKNLYFQFFVNPSARSSTLPTCSPADSKAIVTFDKPMANTTSVKRDRLSLSKKAQVAFKTPNSTKTAASAVWETPSDKMGLIDSKRLAQSEPPVKIAERSAFLTALRVTESGGSSRSTMSTPVISVRKQPPLSSLEQSEILKGVHALVCVFLDAGVSAQSAITKQLKSMGAKVLSKFNEKTCTHVIFKQGSKHLYERLRFHPTIKLVSVLWVTECYTQRSRVCEDLFPVETSVQRQSTLRKAKALMPAQLASSCTKPSDFIQVEDRSLKSPSRKYSQNTTAFDDIEPEDSSLPLISDDDCTLIAHSRFTTTSPHVSTLPLAEGDSHDSSPVLFSEQNVIEQKSGRTGFRKREHSCSPIPDYARKKRIDTSTIVKASRRPSVRKLEIVMTNFDGDDHAYFSEKIEKIANCKLASVVSSTTTHVIVGQDKRTMSVLKGMALGCFILTRKWLEDTIASNFPVKEDSYFATEAFAFCKYAKNMPKVFTGLKFVINHTRAPVSDVEDLITLAGGVCLSKSSLNVDYVVDSEINSARNCVSEKWLYDCIMSLKIVGDAG